MVRIGGSGGSALALVCGGKGGGPGQAREAGEEAGKPVLEDDGFPQTQESPGGPAGVVLMGWGRAWG